jgi:hypothetical protein
VRPWRLVSPGIGQATRAGAVGRIAPSCPGLWDGKAGACEPAEVGVGFEGWSPDR